jgi:hypothetical protein
MRTLHPKRQKVGLNMQQIQKAEQQGAMTADILAIITELTARPHKIANAKIAILSDMFEESPVDDTQFVATYIYVPKIPKEWLVHHTLPAMHARMDHETLKLLAKSDRRVDQKLLFFGAGISPNQKIVNHTKQLFDQAMVKRTHELNDPLAKLEWDNETGQVSWAKSGVYQLRPQWVDDADKEQKDHTYTHVECIYLKGAEAKALLVTSALCSHKLCVSCG